MYIVFLAVDAIVIIRATSRGVDVVQVLGLSAHLSRNDERRPTGFYVRKNSRKLRENMAFRIN